MNGRRLLAGITGIFFLTYGILNLFLFSSTIGRAITAGLGGFLPTYQVTASGHSFSVGLLAPLIQAILLIIGGAVITWKRKRWAAIVGIIGVNVLVVTSLSLRLLVSTSGGPSLTELIDINEMVIGLVVFTLLPIAGVVLSWRELN